jgi:acyl-CoA synthetase (AMP-forming)/AMP-acid ligase II
MPSPVIMSSSRQTSSPLEWAVPAEGDSVALAYEDAVFTYRELNSRVGRLAARVRANPGERIVIVAPNVPGLVVALFAVWKLGAVAVPLSARLRSFELERVFAAVKPTAAVSVAAHGRFDLAGEMLRLQANTPTLAQRLIIDPLGNVIDQTSTPGEPVEPLDETVAAILYTSGTTGEPKGVLVLHAQLRAQSEVLPPVLGNYASEPCGLTAPATHSFGLGCMLCTLAARGTLILAEVSASAGPLVNALRDIQARVLYGSPALFSGLLDAVPDLPLRRGLTGGSLCPQSVFERWDERRLRLLTLYGMTESGGACCPRSEDPPDVRYRTAGHPLEGYEIRVAPHEYGSAELGEIQVRSPYISSRYFSRAWTSNETPGDGWFRTGDLGSIDTSGNVSVMGRTKEVIHVGGFNVFPAEVELYLVTHPHIAQAAVIGVPHSVMGEVPQAFVVLDGDVELKPSDVVRFAREGIAGYKVPYGVRILDEMPTLPSGKLDRRRLRELSVG